MSNYFDVEEFKLPATANADEIIDAFFALPHYGNEREEVIVYYAEKKKQLHQMTAEFIRMYPGVTTDKLMFLDALFFAHSRHRHFNQTRNISNVVLVDYVFHPLSVMLSVFNKLKPNLLPLHMFLNILTIAILHDVVEDTVNPADYSDMYNFIEKRFNKSVHLGIAWLTNYPSKNSYRIHTNNPYRAPLDVETLPRSKRKPIDFERLKNAPVLIQIIKLCDMEDNTETIEIFNDRFKPIYRIEMADLFKTLFKPKYHPDLLGIKNNIGKVLKDNGIKI